MAEIRDVDARTACFIEGPFQLESFEYTTAESTYRTGERYNNGLSLTLRNKHDGLVLRVNVPKKDLLYSRIEAMVISRPDIKLLNFTWDDAKGKVLISSVLSK